MCNAYIIRVPHPPDVIFCQIVEVAPLALHHQRHLPRNPPPAVYRKDWIFHDQRIPHGGTCQNPPRRFRQHAANDARSCIRPLWLHSLDPATTQACTVLLLHDIFHKEPFLQPALHRIHRGRSRKWAPFHATSTFSSPPNSPT